jgi:hypothetical protein
VLLLEVEPTQGVTDTVFPDQGNFAILVFFGALVHRPGGPIPDERARRGDRPGHGGDWFGAGLGRRRRNSGVTPERRRTASLPGAYGTYRSTGRRASGRGGRTRGPGTADSPRCCAAARSRRSLTISSAGRRCGDARGPSSGRSDTPTGSSAPSAPTPPPRARQHRRTTRNSRPVHHTKLSMA